MFFGQPCRDIYHLYWRVVVVLINYIAAIDRNAVLELLIDKRNELAKMINRDETITEDNNLAFEEAIIENCLIPLIDGFFSKIVSMPIVGIPAKEAEKIS